MKIEVMVFRQVFRKSDGLPRNVSEEVLKRKVLIGIIQNDDSDQGALGQIDTGIQYDHPIFYCADVVHDLSPPTA
jgi:hypothetical protein